MQPVLQNLNKIIKRFIIALVIFSAAYPTSSYGASLGEAMSLPGFRNLMLTIAMLNKAMNDAAENPMDQWRRQNVAHMMGMMPMAIMGLAKEFQQGKLKDNDLPMVQGVLGGFIDKNVGDKYTAFVRNPSKNMIPAVGKGFPQDMLKSAAPGGQANSGTLMFDEGASKGQAISGDLSATTAIKSVSEQITTLSVAAETATAQNETRATQTLTFEDSAKGGAAVETGEVSGGNLRLRDNSDGTTGYQAAGSTNVTSSEFSSQFSRDLSSVESALGYAPQKREPVKLEKKEEDEEFFHDGTKKISKPKTKREKRGAEYKMEVKPEFFNIVPLLELALSTDPYAHAEDEGGGSKAAEILFGLAAMIAAAAPMVAAAVQADADKKIAKINANAQMAMTKMSSDTSKFLADQQKDIALTQASIAADISKQNQDSTTQRLTMQLAELRAARSDANAVEEKKRLYQQEVEGKRIALAEKQADETVRLANVQMRAQLMATGASQGFSRTINSTGGLVSAGAPLARNTSAVGSNATAGTSASAGGLGVRTQGLGAVAAKSESEVNAKTRASAKLLSNAKGAKAEDGEEDEGEWIIDPKTGKKVLKKKIATNKKRGLRIMRGVIADTTLVGQALRGVMGQNRAVLGSTGVTTAKTEGQSHVATTEAKSFTEYLTRGQKERAVTNTVFVPTPQPKVGGYNAPDMDALDRGLVRGVQGSHRGRMGN